MTLIFLITNREELARSVDRYFHIRGGVEVKVIVPPQLSKGMARLGKLQWVPDTFRKIADSIENQAALTSPRASGLLNAIGLIDVPTLRGLDDLDPINRTKSWSAVVAMLLLAFPEMHWALLSPYDPGKVQSDESLIDYDQLRKFHFPQVMSFCEDLERILKLHDEGFTPLFDPFGFRQLLRTQIQRRADADYIPLRESCAIAIDEEEAYSYLHGYAAYRFGYRAHVVTSFGMMNEVLKSPEPAENHRRNMEVSFEDIYLNFPDRHTSLSKIEARDRMFEGLKNVENRIFVTSGHYNTQTEFDTHKANVAYCDLLNQRGHSKILYKPESGVFDIWERSGMRDRLKDYGGVAKNFKWPPTPVERDASPGSSTHSAPGRLLVVAEQLIRRASRVLKNAESVSEAIYGATLALEAQEYLGLRTPTASLEAISLKHRLEVLAECMFYGVEYHLDTKRRFDEIEEEMESVGIWFRDKTREISKLNAEIGMLSELILIYRGFNQFNEEQAGLAQLRHVHRGLWFQRNKSWAWVFWPIRYYFDQLLVSIPRFIVALVSWLVLFAFLYSRTPDTALRNNLVESNFLHGFKDTIVAFFGMQPPHDLSALAGVSAITVWLTMFIIVAGFVHLGVFVSHLYVMMSRR